MAHQGKVPSDAGGGQPRAERIQQVLRRLMPRLRRHYPALANETIITEVMEEAEKRIISQEQREGRIAKPHQNAWRILRRVAVSRIRQILTDSVQNTRQSDPSPAPPVSEPRALTAPEPIERELRWRQALENLSREERLVCIWRKAGFSSQDIAQHMQRPTAIVNNVFRRAKQKLKKALGARPEAWDETT